LIAILSEDKTPSSTSTFLTVHHCDGTRFNRNVQGGNVRKTSDNSQSNSSDKNQTTKQDKQDCNSNAGSSTNGWNLVDVQDAQGVQSQGSGSVDTQPVQAQPVQAQPVQEQPVQAQPVQEQPVQEQPVQAQPVQEAQQQKNLASAVGAARAKTTSSSSSQDILRFEVFDFEDQFDNDWSSL
jgi:hypothetical protein